MYGSIDISKLTDEQIREEFFRRVQCWQYPSRNVVLLGTAPDNRTAQGNRLAYDLCSCLVSPPELIEQEIKENTELGKTAKESLHKGEVADDLIFKAIDKKLKNPECRKGAIFNGFPLNLQQGKRLDDLMATSETKIHKAYNFEMDDFTINNLSKEETKAAGTSKSTDNSLLGYYRERNILHILDGRKELEEVWKDIGSTLFFD